MLAIHPQGILDFLKAYRDRFKPGCLVTDVCGVKSAIMEGAECLPEGVEFQTISHTGKRALERGYRPPGILAKGKEGLLIMFYNYKFS